MFHASGRSVNKFPDSSFCQQNFRCKTNKVGGENRAEYRVLVGIPVGKRLLRRHRRRWEDNSKMRLQDAGWEGTGGIDLADDTDRCRSLVYAGMDIRIP